MMVRRNQWGNCRIDRKPLQFSLSAILLSVVGFALLFAAVRSFGLGQVTNLLIGLMIGGPTLMAWCFAAARKPGPVLYGTFGFLAVLALLAGVVSYLVLSREQARRATVRTDMHLRGLQAQNPPSKRAVPNRWVNSMKTTGNNDASARDR